jgi:hypothetical protein
LKSKEVDNTLARFGTLSTDVDFEGYWIVGKNLKLTGVSIQQVQNPPEEWFYTI